MLNAKYYTQFLLILLDNKVTVDAVMFSARIMRLRVL
jgi:hypothetical protein